MIPPNDSRVKILLRNNTIVEGIVKEWYGNVVKLQSLDDKSYVIIPHPEEDIILIKVYLEDIPEEIKEAPTSPEKPKTELEVEFQRVLESPSDDPLRTKNLAELKTLMVEQEKQMIIDKLRSHQVGEVKKVKYEIPSFKK